MFARVTLLEIDTLRISVADAVELFDREVLPDLQRQRGYLGVLVMSTPTGGGALVSLWDSAEAAEAGGSSGFYPEVLERFMTIFRAPPGRERYEVAYADLPWTARVT